MAGQLVQICRPIDSSSELMILVGTLRQEVAELRAEVQRLQRENLVGPISDSLALSIVW